MRVSEYLAQNSYTEAQGHNIVNVILVDFRGIDTMGEITVLTIAALGVYVLMRMPRNRAHERSPEPEPAPPEEEAPVDAPS
jgi:multicomponent Na+:H+ antiporter subunit A